MISQRDNMKFYFECNPGKAIPVYELIKFGLQYQRVLKELRDIEKFPVYKCYDVMINGQRQTAYMYSPDGQQKLF